MSINSESMSKHNENGKDLNQFNMAGVEKMERNLSSEQNETNEANPVNKGLESNEGSTLKIPLSQSLFRKLKSKSQAEGVSPEDLASELLAEGLVLRAWEIMERKSAMRQQNGHSAPYQQNQRNQTKPAYRNGHQNFSRGRSPNNKNHSNQNQHRRSNYNNILDNNANFLEYVRSQEKNK